MIIAPIISLILFVIYMNYVYVQYDQSRKDFDLVRKEHFPILQIADKNLLLIENMKKAFQDTIAANEPSWFSRAKQYKVDIETNLVKLRQYKSLTNSASVLKMEGSLKHFFTLSLKMAQQMMQGERFLAYDEHLAVEFENARDACQKAFNEFKRYQITSFNHMIDQTNVKRKSILMTGLFLGLFLLFTIISITMIISLRTRKSLNALLESVQNMADDNPDFSRRIKHEGSDEVGKLVKQFNRFTQKLEHDHNELHSAKKELEVLNEKLEKLSITDGLTGVFNRRYFNQRIESMWQEKMRSKMPLSLIIIDIDFFKKYNDYYGHQGGDRCLINVVKDVERTLQRATDMLCRYGGEEFAILINGDVDEAEHIARNIHDRINGANYEHKESSFKQVTLSMGIATLMPEQNLDYKALIKKADEALYKSKRDGRNRYTVAQN